MSNSEILVFNSPLETGIRSVSLLVPAYPYAYDLQKLILFDYLIVHSSDLGGPESLHPSLPMRSSELLVRRKLVESGLLLMMSRNLISRNITNQGITYNAGDFAETFLNSLQTPYTSKLKERAEWVIKNFGNMTDNLLKERMQTLYSHWVEEFQVLQKSLGS